MQSCAKEHKQYNTSICWLVITLSHRGVGARGHPDGGGGWVNDPR
jgi:hypothetical protein